MAATERDIEAFYKSGLLAIRALEQAGARRPTFGAEPDARWAAFKGELLDGDRFDLVLRDAAATAPLAFAARAVFAIEGLAADDPFGPDWPGAGPALAMALQREAASAISGDAASALREAAGLWSLAPRSPEASRAAEVTAQSRIVAAGAGAVVALFERFRNGRGLDLAEQVLLVTASPAERQLLGIAAVLLHATGTPRVLVPDATADAARALGFAHATTVLVSDDADPAARDAAEKLGRELGA